MTNVTVFLSTRSHTAGAWYVLHTACHIVDRVRFSYALTLSALQIFILLLLLLLLLLKQVILYAYAVGQ